MTPPVKASYAGSDLSVRVLTLLILLCSPVLAETPTFYRDVLPVFQKSCQSCHRKGEIGPMELMTYKQVRPWAKAIRESVMLKRMPPWFADPQTGKFSNDPTLSEKDIKIISRWVEAGSPAGKIQDAPPAIKWSSEWRIQPDLVLEMPQQFPVPAKSEIDYQYLIFPWKAKQDQWVSGIQIRPSDARIVHHAVLYVREAGSSWLRDIPVGVMYAPPAGDANARIRSRDTREDILAIYTPGANVYQLPDGMARKIPVGADLVLQFHYTSLPKEDTADRTQVAITFTGKPSKRLITLQMGKDDLRIPPRERNYSASVSGTLPNDALLVSLFPHMHLRGKAFEFEIVRPGGNVETLLHVKNFDFNWQLSYVLEKSRLIPKGTRLRWTGYFDNSASNVRNPDPEAEVVWGEQSWEEMMIGFFDVAVDPDIDKKAFFIR